MEIQKYELEVWLNDPTTLNLIEFLKQSMANAKEDLADSNFLMESNNDKEIGYRAGYKDCIQFLLLSVFQQQEEIQDEVSEHNPNFWSQSVSETAKDGTRERS